MVTAGPRVGGRSNQPKEQRVRLEGDGRNETNEGKVLLESPAIVPMKEQEAGPEMNCRRSNEATDVVRAHDRNVECGERDERYQRQGEDERYQRQGTSVTSVQTCLDLVPTKEQDAGQEVSRGRNNQAANTVQVHDGDVEHREGNERYQRSNY